MSDVVERLLLKAEKSSSILRGMAEDKSRRQPDNPTGECVYFWPEPHQTLEGEAAAEITRLRAELASAVAAVAAETERCAQVAEEYPTNDYAIGMAMKGVAAAIRKGG